MSLPSRNTSSYTYATRSVGSLLQENGDLLLQENGDQILLENPTQNPNLTTRNISSYTYPSRH